MIIRKAALADAAEIAALTKELGYSADEQAVEARLARILGRPDHLAIVSTIEGRIAGWLQAHAADVIEAGFRVEIVGLVVGADFRRKGVGRMLVERAEEWSIALGAEFSVVRSNTQRVESHEFYPALGYARRKRRRPTANASKGRLPTRTDQRK